MGKHAVILVNNEVNTQELVKNLKSGFYDDFRWLTDKSIGEFSQVKIDYHIEEEERHDQKTLTKEKSQSLKSMSSGERKKALLAYLTANPPEVLVVINPFDSLDIETKKNLMAHFKSLSQEVSLIQITNRVSDILPFTDHFYHFNKSQFQSFKNLEGLKASLVADEKTITRNIPQSLAPISFPLENLVECKNVSVLFNGKPVLNKINWTIRKGEFWQLIGPNGSGKSTLLNLITGDSHKGYGQDLTLFGHKKGSGESVWDLKEMIGYFSPGMVDRFRGYHTLEHMLISGIHDSVGLYVKPSESEKNKALQWLQFLGLEHKKQHYFHELSMGSKRLLMTARAMIKHPPLLILDEPTVGLDDTSSSLFVALVNAYAKESKSSIIYVSHRREYHLNPKKWFELQPSKNGSTGLVNSP
jgi:molybdate transport system ATP-binding protein